MSYGLDLRRRVVGYVRQGGSKAEAARRFGVSRGRVYTWLRLGDGLHSGLKPGPKGGRKVPADSLAAAIGQRPDALQGELAARYGVHKSTICRALRKLKVSRKKNVGLPGVVAISKAPQKISEGRCQADSGRAQGQLGLSGRKRL